MALLLHQRWGQGFAGSQRPITSPGAWEVFGFPLDKHVLLKGSLCHTLEPLRCQWPLLWGGAEPFFLTGPEELLAGQDHVGWALCSAPLSSGSWANRVPRSDPEELLDSVIVPRPGWRYPLLGRSWELALGPQPNGSMNMYTARAGGLVPLGASLAGRLMACVDTRGGGVQRVLLVFCRSLWCLPTGGVGPASENE